MIDFRYHIVSLISVFLALAVGIVLGAGPLRDYIAESLSGQVEQLREESETLRAELDSSTVSLDDATAFIDAAGPTLTRGVLPAYPVSIVTFPDVGEELVDAVEQRLDDAGARVENSVRLGEDLLDPAKRPFRSGIGSNLTTYMDPEPAQDASAEAIIGQALDQALTLYDPASPTDPSAEALAMLELLASADLITHDGELRPTLLTVLLTSDDPLLEEEQGAGLGLIKGMSAAHTIVAGADEPDTLLSLVRTDSDAAQTYATLDSVGTTAAQIILPRALAALVTGDVGTFGFAEGATVLPPGVDLKEPEPIKPEVDEDDDDDDGDDSAESSGS